MRTALIPLLHTLAVAVRNRAALHLEILALRQQLAVLHRSGPKPPYLLRPIDRLSWACLSRLWPGWRNPQIIVKPDTFLAYYHSARTHLSLHKDAPDGRAVQPPTAGKVAALPHLGGLHHEYVRLAA